MNIAVVKGANEFIELGVSENRATVSNRSMNVIYVNK